MYYINKLKKGQWTGQWSGQHLVQTWSFMVQNTIEHLQYEYSEGFEPEILPNLSTTLTLVWIINLHSCYFMKYTGLKCLLYQMYHVHDGHTLSSVFFFLEKSLFLFAVNWHAILQHSLYFPVVEDIHKKREPLCTMDGIYLITPAQKSVDAIINDFAVGNRIMYRAAHVFFTEGTYISRLSYTYIYDWY